MTPRARGERQSDHRTYAATVAPARSGKRLAIVER